MSDVASLSVAMHVNSAAFKSQIADAYQSAGRSSKTFSDKQKVQANELAATIARTAAATKSLGMQKAANSDIFSGAIRGAGQLNFVLHEVASGSNVASSTIINALIPAVHSLKKQLTGSEGGWRAQQEAAKSAAAELAESARQQIVSAQAEKAAALNKADMAQKTIVAAQAQREQAIALDEYFAKQSAVNKLHGVTVSYQEEHVKNERAIIEANRAEAAALDKLNAAQVAATAADVAESEGKAALTVATEAATAASAELTVSQRLAATGSRALSSAMGLLGGPVGIGLSVLAAGGTLLYGEFKKAEEQTKKLNAAVLDLSTSSLVSAADLKKLNNRLGDTENSVDAVTAAAKAGFSGQMLTDVSSLATAYGEAGGNAQTLVTQLASLRGDPVSAMEKLTAQGIALSDATIQQVLALNKRGDAAQASQIIIEAALEAEKARLSDLGVEVDKTSDSVNNLGNTFGGMGLQATQALIDSSLYLKKLQRDVDSASARFIAASKAGWAEAENARLKNTTDLKNYLTSGTSAAERRAEAIKKLNDSIYKPGSADYRKVLDGINKEYEKATKKAKTSGGGESEGQRDLEQARQKNAVLQSQLQNTHAQTESEKQLAAFDRKISDLKGEHLSRGQQSLVSMQGQIRAQLQANVLLEREAVLRKTITKWQGESAKWQEEAAAMQREADRALAKYALSDSQSENVSAQDTVNNRFNQRRISLDKDFTDKTSAEYKTRLADLESWKEKELAIVEKSVQEKLNAEADYTAGFRRGTLNWIDSARDANSQMAGFAGTLFDDMTDSLTTFATTGKLSFRSFTISVLSDLSKIAMKVALSNALQSILGAAGGLFGSGSAAGSTGSAISDFASRFSFNAKGGVYDSPSLSSYSGGVYSSPQLFAFAKGAGVFGEAGPEAIMPLTRSADGSLGVRATGGGSDSPGQTIINVSAPVSITTSQSGGQSSGSGAAGVASQLKVIVETTLTERLKRELSPGGLLYQR